ncbi:DUF1992 domain-containing protein [Bacillus carboniphilus]|uniref:DUF1992 domain-containing protein n=1 Tax=Bacillus carboniphilus TaxID=86663 RepID=A0ABY9JSX0_9BACI|nr:DUF1992 domain-containing protein [Bacillus carboniphilus]WLR42487.1 DUF1992 domain-containing protein [Bacillus carboniphilus]
MDFSTIISEDRIKRAYEDGVFDHLEGYGKLLPKDDASHLPPELRMAYRIMKNGRMIVETEVKKRDS